MLSKQNTFRKHIKSPKQIVLQFTDQQNTADEFINYCQFSYPAKIINSLNSLTVDSQSQKVLFIQHLLPFPLLIYYIKYIISYFLKKLQKAFNFCFKQICLRFPA
ncbi:transmembrane protein, putative (macronuclear) [Tetrahymena thermophila SB210]|uniref:Transmembrane protein, putative n=1 Tax=Tetrahymena thermophila (strain SB210) TaxID=312017 RepID=Q22G43_TETTS|nr:transmembrane protein, putative [Tetrahymena thermophila SB210]EAR84183.2 transmembrane protein, putative [Tetrahymena thermophila SB210]|eukprot:XP_001031846.2 transmembrane protein, putative [Tetrahymena thermophila SB210]